MYRAYSVIDLGRVDMIWDGGAARCFELDISPDMSPSAVFPRAVEAAGLTLSEVLDSLVSQYV